MAAVAVSLGAFMHTAEQSAFRRNYGKAASLLAYVVAGFLSVGWVRPTLWSGWCGTANLSYFTLCELWCGIMLLCALIEHGRRCGSGRIALRFVLAGIAPVAIPLIVRLA